MGLLLSWLYQRLWIALGSLIGLLIVVLVGPYLPNAKWWTGPAVIILAGPDAVRRSQPWRLASLEACHNRGLDRGVNGRLLECTGPNVT